MIIVIITTTMIRMIIQIMLYDTKLYICILYLPYRHARLAILRMPCFFFHLFPKLKHIQIEEVRRRFKHSIQGPSRDQVFTRNPPHGGCSGSFIDGEFGVWDLCSIASLSSTSCKKSDTRLYWHTTCNM